MFNLSAVMLLVWNDLHFHDLFCLYSVALAIYYHIKNRYDQCFHPFIGPFIHFSQSEVILIFLHNYQHHGLANKGKTLTDIIKYATQRNYLMAGSK